MFTAGNDLQRTGVTVEPDRLSSRAGSKTLNLKHICLLSLQQHHPLFCINGHPGIYGGDIRLSADRRRRQSRENRVQEVLEEEEEEEEQLTWLSVSFHSFPPGGSSSFSPAVTTMLML